MKQQANKLTAWFILLCCMAVSLMVACTEDEEETTGSIYGIVNDAYSGDPIAVARVTLNPSGKSTNTGSDGRYEFLDMEPGQYTIQISKTGYKTNSKSISVVAGKQAPGDMLLEPEAEEADIQIEPSTLNFGTTQDELSVTLTNRGNAITEWALNLGENPWLSASPTSGNIAANKTQSIIFRVDRDKLSETKNIKVSLSAFGNSYIISVSCSPKNTKSEMSISPTTLDFGATEQEKTISIKNTGNAPLAWNIAGISEECISVSDMKGEVQPEGSQVVKVSLDRSKMPQDLNTNFIISDGIKEQPVTITATKAVAKMSVSPLALDFGEESTEQNFTISNTGTAELTWSITVPEGMGLKVSETNGTTAPSGNKQITVTLDRAAMPENLDTSIEVSDGTNKETISVKGIKGNNVAGTVVPQGLYVYYKFDDNFEDATENEIHGFGTATPSFVEGITPESKAVKFSKTNNSTFVVANPIIDSKEMTISFWGKDFSDGHIFHMTSSYQNDPMCTLTMIDGQLKFVVTRNNNGNYNYNAQAFVHPTLTDGKWHHIVILSDFCISQSSVITNTLYVDGQKVNSVTEGTFAWASSYGSATNFTMGGNYEFGYNHSFTATNMSVDNFRVYDTRRLSASEIKEIYNAKQ